MPIVQKYGGVLVGLCLDEEGIPPTAEQRFEIAKKIRDRASEYGIKPKNLVMDSLSSYNFGTAKKSLPKQSKH